MKVWMREPDILTDYLKKRWFTNHAKRNFVCDICGNKLEIGKRFASIFTNFNNHHGGNPFVGECCIDLEPKVIIAIWDRQRDLVKQIPAISKEQILREGL